MKNFEGRLSRLLLVRDEDEQNKLLTFLQTVNDVASQVGFALDLSILREISTTAFIC
jgi:hypothetical protein